MGLVAAISPPRPPSLGEGGDVLKDMANPLDDDVGPIHGIRVGEAEHHDAALAEESVAKSVTSLPAVVRRAVDLDGELDRNTEEIGEVWADGKLASE